MTTIPKSAAASAAAAARLEHQWLAPSRGMAAFHASFKHAFETNYALADGSFHMHGMTLPAFLQRARGVARSLDAHHRIEEAHIFPYLHKHPSFRPSSDHVQSHRIIHDGLERYNAYLDKASRDPASYNAREFRAVMDSFRKPLYDHLDQEVRDLEPESLRAAGVTLDEVRMLPF
ncbi:hypothetical protein CC85DRAFT_284828 [Cutaneotrichosporon oleaginosum]|uniref:Hemerythrin-like domain-containing protein n=1 Tax=Cutaneotrichosporon oleaginosum TaxID=879819 RepID=A0A0J0XPM0_9TREE|nr:uncharacterized protein CC85DRAFT_284828 [Cutaneotrichosporon oleaginosum]KLT43070.1 hypothetical protein CC85DRAFT_284828 [Cutaneotrichosporon oleaginosum]TXT10002.1 hypothetical protein COLE_03936 [Cutaneotrichosporon oleaginosum]